jgi:hypothetical protein
MCILFFSSHPPPRVFCSACVVIAILLVAPPPLLVGFFILDTSKMLTKYMFPLKNIHNHGTQHTPIPIFTACRVGCAPF